MTLNIDYRNPDAVLAYLEDLDAQLQKCARLGTNNENAVANVNGFIDADLREIRSKFTGFSNNLTHAEKEPVLNKLEAVEQRRRDIIREWKPVLDARRKEKKNV